MPYHIEVISVGGDFDAQIAEAAQSLNCQDEFRFSLPPARLRKAGGPFAKAKYRTREVFGFLRDYRSNAKGERPYLIGVIDKELDSSRLGNIFGSHEACDGLAVVTLFDHLRFVESTHLYLCYYLIRYALSFVCPTLKNHAATRGCFFDRKMAKKDILISLDSGAFCEPCRVKMWEHLNEETHPAIQKMVSVMKALRTDSEADLDAVSLQNQVDVGIITMREDDEYESVLASFRYWRHVRGTGSDYSYTRVQSRAGEELRIALARTPDQGPGPAQAIASSMINDLNPRWIFLVGIAGGLPASEYTLGDVLLSQRMHDFSVSAAIEGKEPEFEDMGGPMALEVEKLVTTLRSQRTKLGAWNSRESIGLRKPREKLPATWSDRKFYGDKAWRESVFKSLRSHFPSRKPIRDPIFRAAVIITSGVLLKDTKLATLWKKTARHASGVEMELGGVCRAARHGKNGKTKVLAIRALSDIVGYKRSPEWTEFAAYSAAAFTHALIVSGIIRREDGDP